MQSDTRTDNIHLFFDTKNDVCYTSVINKIN